MSRHSGVPNVYLEGGWVPAPAKVWNGTGWDSINVKVETAEGFVSVSDVSDDSPVLWEDTFDRANATGLAAVGNGWFDAGVNSGANANIVSNALIKTDSGNYRCLGNPAGGFTTSEFTLRAEVGSNSGAFFGIYAAYASSNLGAGMFFNANSSQVYYQRSPKSYIDNTYGDRSSGFPSSWTSGVAPLSMAIKIEDDKLSFFVNDTLLDEIAIATPVFDGVGSIVVGISGEGNNRSWDNVQVLTND